MKAPVMEQIIRLGQLRWWQGRVAKERQEHRLNYLFWECTHACNLRCRHCGSDCGPRLSEELSTEEIMATFKSVAEDFDARRIMLAITGGEPLLRKDLFEVMKYARSLGFRWGMVTNGTLIDDTTINNCREAGMSTVTVSIDGLRETHDHIRRLEGSFDTAVNALKLFKASGYFAVVQATTCVSDYNFGELRQLYDVFSAAGVDEWRLLTVNPIGRAKDDPRFRLSAEQLVGLLDFIIEARKKKGLRVTFEEEGFLGPDYEGRVRDNLFYCPAGINIASILYDGSISACPNLPRSLIQGNVRKDRFKHIWDNQYKQFRDSSWKKTGECKDCEWWPVCMGNSLHLWDMETGKPVICHLQAIKEGSTAVK
ncbi:radical SAM protein [Methanocella sp. MCL-LM]|uniref:radical SAM protein n=1 Tax=Methanocella sp. MCL-LM TaxID=3412035 RepID=UPI003C776EF8